MADDILTDLKKVANFFRVEDIKEQHSNPSFSSKIVPTYTPPLKPKVDTRASRRNEDWQGRYISIFDRDRPYQQIKSNDELEYLKRTQRAHPEPRIVGGK